MLKNFAYLKFVKKLIVFVFILFTTSLNAQYVGAYNDGSRRYETTRENLSLSISPLALLDVYSGSAYKAGISIRPYSSIRITADAGGYLMGMAQRMSLWRNLKGYHFRGTVGLLGGYMSEWSLGLEYQYKKQSFSYLDSVPDQPEFTSYVDKFVHVGNVFLACQVEIMPRIYVEIRGALGVRYRDIFNTRSDAVSESVYWRDSMNQGRITNKQSLMPNVSLAVRLNYILWLDSNY